MASESRLIVIGASVGGFDALKAILSQLDANFPLPIMVVVHIGVHESILPELLGAHTGLCVRHAVDGEAILPGTVYAAPPDHHLLVNGRRAQLTRGPKENFARPAVDPLFRSAALAYGRHVIGVILSGNLDDGTVGLQAVKAYGGMGIVQEPSTATAASMPASALQHVKVDHVLPAKDIGAMLLTLAEQPSPTETPDDPPPGIALESQFQTNEESDMDEMGALGRPSGLTCPECGGALWELHARPPQRFRCHVGHAYTATALDVAHQERVEESIWAAVRALHEKEALLRRFALATTDQLRRQEHHASADMAKHHAEQLRRLIST